MPSASRSNADNAAATAPSALMRSALRSLRVSTLERGPPALRPLGSQSRGSHRSTFGQILSPVRPLDKAANAVELATLEPDSGQPVIEEDHEFDRDARAYKVRHVFVVKFLDWKGIVRVAGELMRLGRRSGHRAAALAPRCGLRGLVGQCRRQVKPRQPADASPVIAAGIPFRSSADDSMDACACGIVGVSVVLVEAKDAARRTPPPPPQSQVPARRAWQRLALAFRKAGISRSRFACYFLDATILNVFGSSLWPARFASAVRQTFEFHAARCVSMGRIFGRRRFCACHRS